MDLRQIFSKLFQVFGKSRETGGAENPAAEEQSPYSRFGVEQNPVLPKPRHHATTHATVFQPAGPATPGKPLSFKDAFLLETVSALSPATVGVFFPGHRSLLIRDPHRSKAGRLIRWEGNATQLPLFGDWNGGGRESLGFFDPGLAAFHLWTAGMPATEQQEPELSFLFGPAGLGWIPLAGDWNGDGKDGIGLYDPASSSFVLRNDLSGGEPDLCFMYGPPGLGWIPLAGDWNGDGKDGVGVYDPLTGSFLLRNELSGGDHDQSFRFPAAGPDWIPLAGDWNGDGTDSVGIYDPNSQIFYLCNRSPGDDTDLVFRFGPVGVSGLPFALRWVP